MLGVVYEAGAAGDWRRDPALAGGGVLTDMIHGVYQAEALVGEPIRRVSAHVSAPGPDWQVEDLAACVVRDRPPCRARQHRLGIRTRWHVRDRLGGPHRHPLRGRGHPAVGQPRTCPGHHRFRHQGGVGPGGAATDRSRRLPEPHGRLCIARSHIRRSGTWARPTRRDRRRRIASARSDHRRVRVRCDRSHRADPARSRQRTLPARGARRPGSGVGRLVAVRRDSACSGPNSTRNLRHEDRPRDRLARRPAVRADARHRHRTRHRGNRTQHLQLVERDPLRPCRSAGLGAEASGVARRRALARPQTLRAQRQRQPTPSNRRRPAVEEPVRHGDPRRAARRADRGVHVRATGGRARRRDTQLDRVLLAAREPRHVAMAVGRAVDPVLGTVRRPRRAVRRRPDRGRDPRPSTRVQPAQPDAAPRGGRPDRRCQLRPQPHHVDGRRSAPFGRPPRRRDPPRPRQGHLPQHRRARDRDAASRTVRSTRSPTDPGRT